MGSFGDGTLAGFCWGENVFGFYQNMLVGFCLGGIQLYQGWNNGCDFSWREHWLDSEEGTLVGIYWLRNAVFFFCSKETLVGVCGEGVLVQFYLGENTGWVLTGRKCSLAVLRRECYFWREFVREGMLVGFSLGGNTGWDLSRRELWNFYLEENTSWVLSGREHSCRYVDMSGREHICRYVDLVDICRVGNSGFFQ